MSEKKSSQLSPAPVGGVSPSEPQKCSATTEQPPKATTTRFWLIFPHPTAPVPLERHKITILFTVASAGLLIMPPRTITRNFILGGATVIGVWELRYHWTGQTFAQRMRQAENDLMSMFGGRLPPAAKEASERIRREKEARLLRAMAEEDRRKYLEEKRRDHERKQAEMTWERRYLKNWQEDQEAFARGEGLWDIIWRDVKEAFLAIPGARRRKEAWEQKTEAWERQLEDAVRKKREEEGEEDEDCDDPDD